eukprot:CAMPEP_0194494078 /NCGR_PEP_ID=MMETSP0253-20130528/12095_1 /TAXON_ID=2966 /ORGANISM="Noctiluca scintillans" /LENGTH=63 /DNA_ID=CAMNT_0039335139 /DNA_START=404 /DNA_END=595 /DNA_ORIENTATION=+
MLSILRVLATIPPAVRPRHDGVAVELPELELPMVLPAVVPCEHTDTVLEVISEVTLVHGSIHS